mgnify:CR=1 FL=1
MNVLICGDRDWWEMMPIVRVIDLLPEGTIVVHGAARGADRIAGKIASAGGFAILSFPADWARYHKGAGPIRNQQMLDEGKPDLVIYFHHDLEDSKGTKNMVTIARKAGISVLDGVKDIEAIKVFLEKIAI